MSNKDDLALFRKFYKFVKRTDFNTFVKEMNVMHTRAYAAAQRHYREAMFICLTPKQRDAVEAKVIEIRELWDGMATVKTDNTKAELLLKNEVVDELKMLKEENARLKARLGE